MTVEMNIRTTVKEQWDDAAESWVKFVRSGKNYYTEYLNGPALKQRIGNVTGKKVLDIGCGEGFLSRFFAAAGAEVTGVDISEKLIKAAVEEEGRRMLGIRYLAADAADLSMLGSEGFDVVSCFMALMDMLDYDGVISEVSRVLKTEGKFITVLEHPCFTANRLIEDKPVSGWVKRTHKNGTKEYPRFWLSDYFHRHSCSYKWNHARLPSSFVTTGFHRTLSDYVNSMCKHGLAITGMDEPQPLEEGVRLHPPMAKHYRIPHTILIEATKTRML